MATAEARWRGPENRAKALLSAIQADDPDLFEMEMIDIGRGVIELVICVEAESLGTLQATMDDLLACLAAAEVSLDAVQD
ncbi:MAG TPA: hypothetical protein EYQ80_01185 [Candidatus Poseidoniales archaeon]|nr:hypothetical protein [Candidatus Poseidoniales archaeon]